MTESPAKCIDTDARLRNGTDRIAAFYEIRATPTAIVYISKVLYASHVDVCNYPISSTPTKARADCLPSLIPSCSTGLWGSTILRLYQRGFSAALPPYKACTYLPRPNIGTWSGSHIVSGAQHDGCPLSTYHVLLPNPGGLLSHLSKRRGDRFPSVLPLRSTGV